MANTTIAMPNNLDAEQALLGCLLIDNEIASDVLDKLGENDFYQESHQYIIKGMKLVFNDRKPIDIITVCDQLDKEMLLDKAGGISYITNLAQNTPSSANYRYYFGIVKRDSTNRSLIRAARSIIENSVQSENERDSISYAEKLVYDISKSNDSSALVDLRESGSVQDVIEKFTILGKDKNAFKGIPSGFTKLDRVTNGLQRSDLIVVAGRPGMGKTSFSMNIVEHAALVADNVCAVFSLEMPRNQLTQRLLCSYSGVSMADALSGNLNVKDWKKLMQGAEALNHAKIFVDDSSRTTPAEVLSKCRRLKSRMGRLDLIMIDYIQLMSSGNPKDKDNRVQEVANITRDLKIMAKELDVPVIALSQLRRTQNKEPQLTDLRESGAIEQDADIVMFISRPDVMATAEEIESGAVKKGMAEIIIAKHRNGACDRIPLRFKGELTKFVNLTEDELGAPSDEQVRRDDEMLSAVSVEDVPFDTDI